MTSVEPLLAVLDRAGYQRTEPRRLVATMIAQHDGHFTAPELVRESRRRGLPVGRATIFRALDVFLALGLVERLDLPDGEHAYVMCEPSHHHHVVCQRCGRTVEVDDRGLRAVVQEIEQRTGYAIDSHRVELFGTCPACQALDTVLTARAG
ncbi:MAG TPA: Fur family transcriptional regulator [Candidatus Sulfotelmatobacter sp.]|nr:Fur family transcriptional regulator [Candidatus Sulfotelmatobacter sp.]